MYIHISVPNYKEQSLNLLGYVLVYHFHPQILSTLRINTPEHPISSYIERTELTVKNLGCKGKT